MTNKTQVCPYCRHESNEHEMIPTNITNMDTHNTYMELANIHMTIEQSLRDHILVLTRSLSLETARAAAAEDWAAAAEDAAKNALDSLDEYKATKRSEDVTVKKVKNKENWAKWTGTLGAVGSFNK